MPVVINTHMHAGWGNHTQRPIHLATTCMSRASIGKQCNGWASPALDEIPPRTREPYNRHSCLYKCPFRLINKVHRPWWDIEVPMLDHSTKGPSIAVLTKGAGPSLHHREQRCKCLHVALSVSVAIQAPIVMRGCNGQEPIVMGGCNA
jgi:hypothetical protein